MNLKCGFGHWLAIAGLIIGWIATLVTWSNRFVITETNLQYLSRTVDEIKADVKEIRREMK